MAGSSPRMRGTLPLVFAYELFPGIIPAHAGNTGRMPDGHEQRRDHPRACGEHYLAKVARVVNMGSSPRMRGTPGTRYDVWHHAGIIPAHAGNTLRN